MEPRAWSAGVAKEDIPRGTARYPVSDEPAVRTLIRRRSMLRNASAVLVREDAA